MSVNPEYKLLVYGGTIAALLYVGLAALCIVIEEPTVAPAFLISAAMIVHPIWKHRKIWNQPTP